VNSFFLKELQLQPPCVLVTAVRFCSQSVARGAVQVGFVPALVNWWWLRESACGLLANSRRPNQGGDFDCAPLRSAQTRFEIHPRSDYAFWVTLIYRAW
jgi:hypothetical protein